MEDKSIVYQNCSKCGVKTTKAFKCVKCHKVFCKNEVGDKVKIGKGYQLETERCKDCKHEAEKQQPVDQIFTPVEKSRETCGGCPVHCKNYESK